MQFSIVLLELMWEMTTETVGRVAWSECTAITTQVLNFLDYCCSSDPLERE